MKLFAFTTPCDLVSLQTETLAETLKGVEDTTVTSTTPSTTGSTPTSSTPAPKSSTHSPEKIQEKTSFMSRIFSKSKEQEQTKETTLGKSSLSSHDECDGNPMVSGFQVDLDPDDLQIGSGVNIVAEEDEESKHESEECAEVTSTTNAKLVHCGLPAQNLNSVNSEEHVRTRGKSAKCKASPVVSEVQDQPNTFLDFHDADPFTLSQSKPSSSVLGMRESEEEEKGDHLDDWLNSEEGTISNPYVSNSNVMPEGATLQESDADEGPPGESTRVLEKVDPHSCSTSRSDSPAETSERKKKHKRKDKEKKEKDDDKSLVKRKKKSKDKDKEKEKEGVEKKKKKKKKDKDKDGLEEFFNGSPEKEFDEAYEAI
ncbi:hypothetical protein GWK47_054374 [Chionoecetes opilio]|uniref:Uncharacterized protein n=1 Tax=Chionoecetes opilio TaxID=41210 RepID=A0A8J4Y646_CHIOP|nr:hypothetical protein GWK47_054374 [Chionoecetes opilio]